jgi:hypothetical protein
MSKRDSFLQKKSIIVLFFAEFCKKLRVQFVFFNLLTALS